MRYIKSSLVNPDSSLAALQAAYEKAESIESVLKRHQEKYIATKSKLSDKQFWDTRRTKVGERLCAAELEATQLTFSSNRLALQCLTSMFSAMSELIFATAKVREEVKSGDDPHTRRVAMNNLIMASQLQYRLSRLNSIEWGKDEKETLADERYPERITDVSFLTGLDALRSAFDGTSGAVTFVDWTAMSWITIDEPQSEEYCELERAVSEVEEFFKSAHSLLEEFDACQTKQREPSYQKKLKAARLDDRKAALLRQEQTKLRADLSSLKICLRELPVSSLRSVLARAAMPYQRTSSKDHDLAIVSNVVHANQILVALYGLANTISQRCSYEDDISFVGLLDIYSKEERNAGSSAWF
jgi:hypothetical protein